MEITTLVFLAFVGLSCLVYYVVPKKFQWCVLLVSSLVFFVSSSALLTVYMLATTGIVYTGARIIQKNKDLFIEKKKELTKEEKKNFKAKNKKKQKTLVAIFSVLAIAILVALKYCNFLGGIVNSVAGIFTLNHLIPEFNILLPLGISYYTLMSVSYIVDVYRGLIVAEKNPLRVLLYVSYFPHIVEGPFDRYKDLDVQFRTPHKFDYERFTGSIVIILFGLFKKLVIADRIGFIVSDYFDNVTETSLIGLSIATIMYTIQLYMDFSGCIDIVAGVSELFGIKVAENFRQPFFSKSINEFWRRWHITLGLWLKEYVFYPVTLSGHFKKVNQFVKKHIKNVTLATFVPAAYSLFFVWFCNGLWHGASVKFIAYGLYYYVLMMLGELFTPLFNKTKNKLHIKEDNKLFALFQILRTFFIVNIGMLLFRSVGLFDFYSYVSSAIFNLKGSDLSWIVPEHFDLVIISLGLILVFIISIIKERGINIIEVLNRRIFIFKWIVVLFLLFSVLLTGAFGVDYGEAAAIYAQF